MVARRNAARLYMPTQSRRQHRGSAAHLREECRRPGLYRAFSDGCRRLRSVLVARRKAARLHQFHPGLSDDREHHQRGRHESPPTQPRYAWREQPRLVTRWAASGGCIPKLYLHFACWLLRVQGTDSRYLRFAPTLLARRDEDCLSEQPRRTTRDLCHEFRWDASNPLDE